MNLLFSILMLALGLNSFRIKTKSRFRTRKFDQINTVAQPNINNKQPDNKPLQGRQFVQNGAGFQNCECASNFQCPPCGPNGYEGSIPNCPCMALPLCPNCIMGKILKQYHDKSASIARKDAQTQNKLALESMLEKKLFETAQKFAEEAAAEEKQAKEAVVLLQEHASKAALARGKMIRAENQAKQVASKALQTMSISTSQNVGKQTPSMYVVQTGTRHVAITQNTPEYQINVGVGSGDGYNDQFTTDFKAENPEYNHWDQSAVATAQEQPLIPQNQIGLVTGQNSVYGNKY